MELIVFSASFVPPSPNRSKPAQFDGTVVLAETLRDTAMAAGLHTLDVLVHPNSQGGLSGAAVLSESHLAAHTNPLSGELVIELATCAGAASAQAAWLHLGASMPDHHLRLAQWRFGSGQSWMPLAMPTFPGHYETSTACDAAPTTTCEGLATILEGCDAALIDDPQALHRVLSDALQNLGWLALRHYRFTPQGATALGLIARGGHVALHSWPEENLLYIGIGGLANSEAAALVQRLTSLVAHQKSVHAVMPLQLQQKIFGQRLHEHNLDNRQFCLHSEHRRLVVQQTDTGLQLLGNTSLDLHSAAQTFGPADAWRAEVLLAASDQMSGLYPGLLARHQEAMSVVAQAQSHRRQLPSAPSPWPTLPLSVVLRQQLLRAALNNKVGAKILLDDDQDGLSLLLGEWAEVSVHSLLPYDNVWLSGCSQHLGVAAPTMAASLEGPYDAVVISAGEPLATKERLMQARASLAAGGVLLARVPFPWDQAFHRLIGPLGLEATTHWRDCDHAWLPDGTVIEGGGDLVLLKAAPPTASKNLVWGPRQLPHDVEALDIKNASDALMRLFYYLDILSPGARKTVIASGSKGTWMDTAGNAVVVSILAGGAKMTVNFLPYHSPLAYGFFTALRLAFADCPWRQRPRRTHHGARFNHAE